MPSGTWRCSGWSHAASKPASTGLTRTLTRSRRQLYRSSSAAALRPGGGRPCGLQGSGLELLVTIPAAGPGPRQSKASTHSGKLLCRGRCASSQPTYSAAWSVSTSASGQINSGGGTPCILCCDMAGGASSSIAQQ